MFAEVMLQEPPGCYDLANLAGYGGNGSLGSACTAGHCLEAEGEGCRPWDHTLGRLRCSEARQKYR